MKQKIDIVVDLQYGDCGKGKVTDYLIGQNIDKPYTHCLRFNGGHNAGHSIIKNGKKIITHVVPCGVFHGIKSIIGTGCVVNPQQLFEEIEQLELAGFKPKKYLKIAHNAHVILDKHLKEDRKDTKIGTTKRGNGPAYRHKYNRTGTRAEQLSILDPYIIYTDQEFGKDKEFYVMCEGAQGYWLDIDWGYYPYVTSSHCLSGASLLNGFNHKMINKVIGVMKAYTTYVGAMEFQPEDEEIFDKIAEEGNEYGATTGRRRQVNWIDIKEVEQAAHMNGTDIIVINKMDILRKLNQWKIISPAGEIWDFREEDKFKNFLTYRLVDGNLCNRVIFSDNPETLE